MTAEAPLITSARRGDGIFQSKLSSSCAAGCDVTQLIKRVPPLRRQVQSACAAFTGGHLLARHATMERTITVEARCDWRTTKLTLIGAKGGSEAASAIVPSLAITTVTRRGLRDAADNSVTIRLSAFLIALHYLWRDFKIRVWAYGTVHQDCERGGILQQIIFAKYIGMSTK